MPLRFCGLLFIFVWQQSVTLIDLGHAAKLELAKDIKTEPEYDTIRYINERSKADAVASLI